MRGDKPTPGTICAALKQLQKNGLIISHKEGRKIIYSLTEAGLKASEETTKYFRSAFGPIFWT